MLLCEERRNWLKSFFDKFMVVHKHGFDYVWVCKMEAVSTVKWRQRAELSAIAAKSQRNTTVVWKKTAPLRKSTIRTCDFLE